MNRYFLESENLKFRPITVDDTEMLLKWRNSDEVRNNFIHRAIVTADEHLAWLRDKVGKGYVIQFIIEEKLSGKPIGSVYFRNIDRNDKTAEYGVFIGETTAKGKGYGTETARRMVDFFFEELNMRKLYLRVLERNTAAVNTYIRAGFTPDPKGKEIIEIEGEKETILFMSVAHTDE